jgi:hypothetical protein
MLVHTSDVRYFPDNSDYKTAVKAQSPAPASEINLIETFDARVWADEFCRIVGEKVPAMRHEQEWMTTWFANAIMAGHDHALRNRE